MIQIDKTIPIPPRSNRRKAIYPFRDMSVGDSFLWPDGKKFWSETLTVARARTGYRFSYRNLPEGIRIWRVE